MNFETDEFKLLQLVIFAQPEFKQLLGQHKNFRDRVSLGYVLNPVDRDETRELIEYRLRQSGYEQNSNLFTDDAIEQIYSYTQGYPRRIISLCHNLLIEMITSESKSVGKNLVVSAIRKEREWNA